MSNEKKNDIDTGGIDFDRKYRVGTRFVSSLNEVFQYGKVDFGIAGKVKGKTIRNIRYQWFRTR